TGEPRQLRQVVSNLLDNAIRFTPPGGRVVVALAADPMSRQARLTVTETGCGIEPHHVPRVFDRFFQADVARDRRDSRRGGGLGLAICRTLVERHGGLISVRSEFGRGTEFTALLPQAP
ncbi:MAG: sensor histidine kinase, partial [Planctomycetia bacterium]